jgi:hypothetical protein
MKLIISLIFVLLSNVSFGQAINDRGLGYWKSTPYSSFNGQTWQLNITPTMFINCIWVGSEYKAVPRSCSAYYNGTVTKQDLINSMNQEIIQVNNWMRSGMIPPRDYQRVQNDIQKTQAILGRISYDTFRMIATKNTGSDSSIYILDLDSVYQVLYGEGGAGSNFHIIEYRR